jgi:dTDP-4-amino-4,6-dideoxygalactose transaminase
MKKLKKMLELRRRNAEMLSKMIYPAAKKRGLKIPEETTDKKFNWYLYTVAFENGRDRIKDALNRAGVGATVYYNPPVHRTPYYAKQMHHTSLPSTDWCADHVLSLPVHPNVTEADVARIVKSLDAAL